MAFIFRKRESKPDADCADVTRIKIEWAKGCRRNRQTAELTSGIVNHGEALDSRAPPKSASHPRYPRQVLLLTWVLADSRALTAERRFPQRLANFIHRQNPRLHIDLIYLRLLQFVLVAALAPGELHVFVSEVLAEAVDQRRQPVQQRSDAFLFRLLLGRFRGRA